MALGLANNPRIEAKIEYWRMERFALPQAMLGDRAIRSEIRQLLGDAEETQKALWQARSEEHTSELQSLMRISYAVFCLKKKKKHTIKTKQQESNLATYISRTHITDRIISTTY